MSAGSSNEERFDIYDDSDAYIGTASRSETHARGYWHRSFHCWVARREGSRKLVMFQLRHADKDTFPLHYDITAAGHLSAGETVRQAAREIEEELGIPAAFEMLIPLGTARFESRGIAQGVPFIDREISEVYALVYDGSPASLQLQADEVTGIFEAELETMIELFEGRLDAAPAQGFVVDENGAVSCSERNVTASQFVSRPLSHYAGVFRSLLAHI